MKLALPFLAAAVASLASHAALACPYAAGTSGCGACGSSLFSYAPWLVLGLGAGIASVAFERQRR